MTEVTPRFMLVIHNTFWRNALTKILGPEWKVVGWCREHPAIRVELVICTGSEAAGRLHGEDNMENYFLYLKTRLGPEHSSQIYIL